MSNLLSKISSSKIILKFYQWKTALAVCFLFAIVAMIYQHCYLDYARRDQIEFMIERNSFQDTKAWFAHAINYSRTRLNSPGDYFLFRPGLYLFLTLTDIFLRDNLVIVGIFSIMLHLTVVVLLYFVFKICFKNNITAFLFAALFASQYMGVEMVAWRHISAYMFSVALALVGFLIVSSKLRLKYLCVVITLFMSMLFHEVIPASFILLTMFLTPALVFRNRHKVKETFVTSKLIYILVATLILYFTINALNWMTVRPPSIMGPSDHFSLSYSFLREALRNFLHYLGSGTRSVLNPFSMQLTWDKSLDDWAYFTWDLRRDPVEGYLAWGGIGIFLLLAVMSTILLRVCRGKEGRAEIITLWACCGLIGLTAIYSFGRLTLRNLGYGMISTYYYWFFSFFYIIILKFLIDEILQKIPPSWWKKTICFIGCIIVMIMVVAQIRMAKNVLSKNYDLAWAKHIQQAIRTSAVYFSIHPDDCLDPNEKNLIVPPRKLWCFTLPYYLNQYNCGWVPGTSIVHLVRTDTGVTIIQPGPYPDHYEK